MSSPTGGVKSFSLQGRLYRERERLTSMTDEERQQRRQWIKDQQLSKCEPAAVKGLYEAKNNIFKRVLRAPLDALVPILKAGIGQENAVLARHLIGKSLMGLTLIYLATYYFKYNSNDWTRKGGWRIVPNRRNYFPGETFHTKVGDYGNYKNGGAKPTATVEEEAESDEEEAESEEEEAESEKSTSKTEKTTTSHNNPVAYDLDLIIKNDEINKKRQKEELEIIKKLPRTLGSYYATRGFDKSNI